jgi:hypothetical protein
VQDSMLANVLGAYLDSVKEREFDLPLNTLLRAYGFYDIHFTHSNVEFGKDFIAKLDENGITIQYSFQSKAGDVSQPDFRTGILGQMLESLISGLSHPNFDKNAPRQTILVITGKMLGNAGLELQELNEKIEKKYNLRPVIVWDQETLIQLLETYGLGGIYQTNASGFLKYGNFYQLYGKALEGNISQREMEDHSRQWLEDEIPRDKRLLCSAIESNVFASQCQAKGLVYEAFISHLTLIRTIMNQIYTMKNVTELEQLRAIYSLEITNLKNILKQYFEEFKALWDNSDNNLCSIIPGANNYIMYSIHCARIMEVAGALYFLEIEQAERDKVISFIVNFISQEPGFAHIPSDYYAVSLVLPVLSLCSSGHRNIAEELLQRSVVWLCDRYQDGFGLADISAEPYDEIAILFGHPFDFIRVQPRNSSFTASIICDLANFVANAELYTNIVNDIKAVKIFPQYWQIPDTKSLFILDGEDIINYPNVGYADDYIPFESFNFAEHVKHEPRSFSITEHTKPIGLLLMMPLLRDRYFPTLWSLSTS